MFLLFIYVFLFYIQVCSITQPRTELNDACVGVNDYTHMLIVMEKRTRVPYDNDTHSTRWRYESKTSVHGAQEV